jgi:hypothetical protein
MRETTFEDAKLTSSQWSPLVIPCHHWHFSRLSFRFQFCAETPIDSL